MDMWIDSWIGDRWIDRYMDGQVNVQMDRQKDILINIQIFRSMNAGCTDGYVGKWIDIQKDRQMGWWIVK